MLISKVAITPTNNRNYKRFKNLGYEFKIGDKILAKIEDLSTGSKSIVSVKCDVCGLQKDLKYSMYVLNVGNYGIYTCIGKCSSIKRKKTCLERFGTETPMQNNEIRNKVGEYFLSKYKIKHPSMLLEFEEKKKSTNLKRYGVSHQMEILENTDKIKKTKLEKYGDENYNNMEKHKETCLKKYGDENYNNVKKAKQTFLERYGVDNNMKSRDLFMKNQISRFRIKYIGNLSYQGSYELDFIKRCQLFNINIENGPSIEYVFDGKNHTYHSDFYIPEYNLICEIKSSYIYNMEIPINESKREYSIINGYKFLFIIDKNYIDFEKIINIQ
jgi:hypothetical protein